MARKNEWLIAEWLIALSYWEAAANPIIGGH